MIRKFRRSFSQKQVKKKSQYVDVWPSKRMLVEELMCEHDYKIDRVAYSLEEEGIISGRKLGHIELLVGSYCKSCYLVDVVYGKGDGAIYSLYQALKAHKLWKVADALKPKNAPHQPSSTDELDSLQDGMLTSTSTPSNDPPKKPLPILSLPTKSPDDGQAGVSSTQPLSAPSLSTASPDTRHVDASRRQPLPAANLPVTQSTTPNRTQMDASHRQALPVPVLPFRGLADSPDGRRADGRVHHIPVRNSRNGGVASSDTGVVSLEAELSDCISLDDSGNEKQNEETMEKENNDIVDANTPYQLQLPDATVVTYELHQQGAWTDAEGLGALKERGKEVLVYTENSRYLFYGNRAPWKAFLLHGPETDMMYAIRAVARETDVLAICTVSCVDVVRGWYTDGIMEKLFNCGKGMEPSIIFVSNVEALSQKESRAAKQVRAEFLKQLDITMKGGKKIFVVAGSTKPNELDEDLVNRFSDELYLTPPDSAERLAVILQNLDKSKHFLTETQLENIVEKTEGFTRSNLAAMCQEAENEPKKRSQAATYFRMEGGYYIPCQPQAPGATQMSIKDIPLGEVAFPKVNMRDMLRAIDNVQTTVNKDLWIYEKFRMIRNDEEV